QNSGTIAEAQQFYDLQSDRIKNILALAAEEISNFLPHTLTRKFNEKYGLDKKNHGIIASPFAAANTPNSGSQFANPYITFNYTYQYYMKKGISRKIVVKEIERLQSAAMKELRNSPELQVEETQAWKEFLTIRGSVDLSLFNIKESYLKNIVEEINASPQQKNLFVSEIILPQLNLFSHKTSCNSHNLVDRYSKLAGCTGTLWNSKSMHTKLQAVPEAGTDMKTIKVLWEHSRNEVYTVQEGSPEALLMQLSDQKICYDLISDAGGYFKEGGNLAIARQMAKVNGNSVVFYNERNEQTETNGTVEVLLCESKTPIPMRSTFLDQCHTTGADVKQKPNAVGLVTIGGNMLLRDLLQAVWRLRGLEKAQRVKFIISKEVESIIRQSLKKNHAESLTTDSTVEKSIAPLSFDDILRFVITNQVKQQGKDNFKALRQELTSVVQSLLLDLLLNNDFSTGEKAKAFAMLEGEWIAEASQSPKDLYGIICHEEESNLVLKQEQEKFIAQINLIFSALPFLEPKGLKKTTALARIQEVCLAHAHSLPAKVLVPLRNMDSDQTVEIEQEMEQEAQTELEVQEHQEREKIELGYISKDVIYLPIERWAKVKVAHMAGQILHGKPMSYWPYFEMKDYCLYDMDLRDFSDAFEGINVSANALEWPKKMPHLSDLKLLGSNRTLLQYVQVINRGQDIIILSHADAALEIKHRPDFDLFMI
ncbi:MAG: hypothetical protein H0W50_12030, partial [Parachlamydiaceae bacterium]|nr:hypothetical protein [Parachlamydiaceae bacterium]